MPLPAVQLMSFLTGWPLVTSPYERTRFSPPNSVGSCSCPMRMLSPMAATSALRVSSCCSMGTANIEGLSSFLMQRIE